MIQQKQIKSANGPECFLKFVNQTQNTVKIDWINHKGDLVTYHNLKPGEEYN